MRRSNFVVGQVLLLAALAGGVICSGSPAVAQVAAANYQSPYTLAYQHSRSTLIGDLQSGERGDHHDEASIPFSQWYTAATRTRWQGWGPTARLYPAPPGLGTLSVAAQRERVVATAELFLGYGYQHHHIPDWNPPLGWPWNPVAMPSNGPGIDCSNLASFVYNLGFGLDLPTNVAQQATQQTVAKNGSKQTQQVQVIPLPASYEARVAALRTGDLLYVRNHLGVIGHVAIWLGPVGQAPHGMPLVLDSHDQLVHDSNGVAIPHGVHLRPFTVDSWYNHDADHALRIIPD